jgi:hypothetical protein
MLATTSILYDAQHCAIKRFGPRNPEKIFFVIQQEGLGRGLFSLISAVICYVDFADRHGFIPVVDFENFPTEYYEKDEIFGSKNAFEYYFYPISNINLEEVYQSQNVIISNKNYPVGYNYTIAKIPNLIKTYDKYFKVKKEIQDLVIIDQFLQQGKVLGIQFRGQEMRTARGHWMPPTPEQMFKAIDIMLKDHSFKFIFVSSEDENLLKIIIDKYSSMVIYNDIFRTSNVNAYKIYPRNYHKYLLGREILVDMLCLSKCDALISCSSNVAWMARFINNNKYISTIFINNGPNSNNRFLSKILWKIKSILPPSLGGFKMNNKVFEQESSIVNN